MGDARRRVPRQERARATVAAVLEAMAVLLRERGLDAITTNHIAERAGVNIGSVYQYFPSKTAIFRAIVEELAARYEERVTDAIARAHEVPLEPGIASILEAHMEALACEAELHVLAVGHLKSAEGAARYGALKGRIVAGVASYLQARRDEAGPAENELASAAQTAVDCVEAVSLASLAVHGRSLTTDPNVRQLFRLAQKYLGR